MGLSVMLYANIGKYFLPSAYFEGFKVSATAFFPHFFFVSKRVLLLF